jgi:hypothetical protein
MGSPYSRLPSSALPRLAFWAATPVEFDATDGQRGRVGRSAKLDLREEYDELETLE